MKKIVLDTFILEEFNYDDKTHTSVINKFDMDVEINKYITINESFNEIIDYYNLYNNGTIYNTLYLIKNNDNEIIGEIELDGEKDNLYINYAILREYRKKGYGTKLIKEITKYLLKRIKTVYLLIKEENEKSRSVAVKTGFTIVEKEKYGLLKYQISV